MRYHAWLYKAIVTWAKTTPMISKYEQTSFVVLNLTIDKMKRSHERVSYVAYSCFELFSFLNPGWNWCDISHLFLTKISAVELLVFYSLISMQNSVATMHRIFQEWTRLQMKAEQRPEDNNARERVILESVIRTANQKWFTFLVSRTTQLIIYPS